MAPRVEAKNVIQMGMFGNLPAIAAGIPEGSKEAVTVGYVVGFADGLSYRNNPNGGEPSIGLNGQFECTPTTPDQPIIVGKTIFLPAGFMSTIIPALHDRLSEADKKLIPNKAPPKGKAIDVKVADGERIAIQAEIGIRRNSGAGVGYEFAVTLVRDAKAVDPFAELRSGIVPAQLQAPTTGTPKAIAAPKKKAKK